MPSALREAEDRSRALDIASYEVALDLTQGTETFRSRSMIRFRCNRDGVTTFADLEAASIRQLELNGTALDVGRVDDGRVDLPLLRRENTLLAEAEISYVSADEGLNRVADRGESGTCVYAKPNEDGAARIFCCFDQPDLRAPLTLSVRTPAGWSCLANAAARVDGSGGEWTFAATKPQAPYQFGLCAGLFDGVGFGCERALGGTLPVTLWRTRRPWSGAEPTAILELLQQPLRYYERALLPYAFDKLDLVFVPRFPALGFSSPGLMAVQDNVLEAATPDLYLATVFAHELAHAWIGGVTDVSHRDEMWLQEALVTYLSRTALTETSAGATPWETPLGTLPDHGYVQDAEKIRGLESVIGREAVLLGIRTLLHRHAYDAATKNDLVDCWSKASGHELGEWPGEPRLDADDGASSR